MGSGNGMIVGPIFYDGALNGDSYNDMLNETIIPSVQHALNIEIFSLEKLEKSFVFLLSCFVINVYLIL